MWNTDYLKSLLVNESTLQHVEWADPREGSGRPSTAVIYFLKNCMLAGINGNMDDFHFPNIYIGLSVALI